MLTQQYNTTSMFKTTELSIAFAAVFDSNENACIATNNLKTVGTIITVDDPLRTPYSGAGAIDKPFTST